MELLVGLLLFIAKTIAVAIAIIVVIAVIFSFGSRRKLKKGEGHLIIKRTNEFQEQLRRSMDEVLMSAGQFKKEFKAEQKQKKKEAKQKKPAKESKDKRRLFVLDFKGDLEATIVESLRHEVTAILSRATDKDEVLIRLESAGGLVHSYGFVASQLTRIKQAGIKLTAAIDRVAASGGYMVAVVADKILAAPFAMIGSIGVAAEIPNLHRLLKRFDIDYDVYTAGEYKRTLTVLGKNTDKQRAKFVEELDDVYKLFKEFVADNRTVLDLEKVATGESWYGKRALNLQLVDELMTSDQYVFEACKSFDVLELKWERPIKPYERIAMSFASLFSKLWPRAERFI